MTYFDFMDKHWFIGFLLTAGVVGTICNMIWFMWNRLLRHLNIRKHGYPPPHCDADGDFLKATEEPKA